MNKSLLTTAAAGIMAGTLTGCWTEQTGKAEMSPKRPNILFIFSDDHATRAISAYSGGEINQTPNIDRIANEGAIFLNSFCANSICGPSRACILTGKHSHKNGVFGNGSYWNGSQMLFPRELKKSGYQTTLYGKWHINGNPGGEFDYWKILIGAGRQGFYYNPRFITSKGEDLTEKGYSTDVITNDAINWLEHKRDKKKPFLLMVQFKAPHVPRMPAPRFINLHEKKKIPAPANLHDDYKNRAPYAKKAGMRVHGSNIFDGRKIIKYVEDFHAGKNPKKIHGSIYFQRMSVPEVKKYVAAYKKENSQYRKLLKAGKFKDAKFKREYMYQRFIKDYVRVVAAIDDNIGRLLKCLEKLGLEKDTIVVYCSDQSYFTGEHGWAEKRFMYEQGLKMPFIIRWPGKIKPGTRVTDMIQNIDYAPTFLDIANIKVPAEMQGKSLKPIMQGQTPKDWRKSIYYHYYEHGGHNVPRHEGVRNGRYKLINYYTDGVWELFDLKNDPNEMKNLYNDPNYKKVIADLKKELLRLRKQYDVADKYFEKPFPKINWWEIPEYNKIMRAKRFK
jgi:arylsulfatase A-like enzyme